jgi:Ca2+-binding EF-hand superfamily protein
MSFDRLRIAIIGVMALALLGGAMSSAVSQVMPPQIEPLPMPDLGGLRMTPAQARTPEDFFVVFDADDNGCIDRSEWRRRIMAIFYALDTEGTMEPAVVGVRGDELLSRSEIPGISEELFLQADIDKDGRLSGYEFNQASWTRFEAANPGIVDCLDIHVFSRFLQSLRPQ